MILERLVDPPSVIDNPLKSPRGDPLRPIIPMLQGPAVRTPFTDLMGNLVSAQEGSTFCANMEMMMLNCLDQYGYNRGMKMCGGYVADLQECRFNTYERTRIQIMQEERKRQFREGKRKERFEECPPHL